MTIGNTQGNSVSINLQQYGCSATPGSTCQVTALVGLTCGTPNPYPITLSFTYTGQTPSGGGGGVQTCVAKGGSKYCADKYGNQFYDCGQPNQVIGQTTADGEGCYNENLVNPLQPPPPPPCGASCTYSQDDLCFSGNCLDGSTNCSFNVNCGFVSGCSSGTQRSCPAAPPPACQKDAVVGTENDCVDQEYCTFNIQTREDCSRYRGGAYNCQRIPGRCGVDVNPTNCRGCLGGFSDCNAACRANGMDSGWCAVPESTDPGRCCACTP